MSKDDEQLRLDYDEIKGHTFAFTGKLRSFTRRQAKTMVDIFGGSAADSVTKTTDYLVIGKVCQPNRTQNGKTIKFRKAQELQEKGSNIRMLHEQDFYDLLRDSI